MDHFLSEDFNFDEFGDVDFQTMSSIMETDCDIFGNKNVSGICEGDSDCIDEFLNLNADKSTPSGIFIDFDEKHTNLAVTSPVASEEEMKRRIQRVESVQLDHAYSCCKQESADLTTPMAEVSNQSPFHHSDSGISTGSGFITSDSSESGSPFGSSESYSTKPLSVAHCDASNNSDTTPMDDVPQFDFSNIELDQLTTTSLDMDLKALFSQDMYHSSQSTQVNAFNSNAYHQQENTSYDASESSAESTHSKDEIRPFKLPSHLSNESKRKSGVCIDLPNFTPLILTDEEKKLLDDEGVSLPTDLPLTKYEERVLKKVRRKIRNKLSAMASRQKKKDYVGGLEARVAQCTNLNKTLSERVQQLEQQNSTLVEQLRKVHDLVKVSTSKTTQATTCVMVMLLSFGLFIAPNYGPLSIQSQPDVAVPQGHKTRKVLEHHPTIEDVKKFDPSDVRLHKRNADVVFEKPLTTSHMTTDDRTLTISMEIEGVAINQVKHDNDSSQNASAQSLKDADLATPITSDRVDENVSKIGAKQYPSPHNDPGLADSSHPGARFNHKPIVYVDTGGEVSHAPVAVAAGSDEM